jgi:phosphoenolpyruvate-protein kinase (PTS system EI component)
MTDFTARRISDRVKWVGFCGGFGTDTILAAAFPATGFVDFVMAELWNGGPPDAR